MLTALQILRSLGYQQCWHSITPLKILDSDNSSLLEGKLITYWSMWNLIKSGKSRTCHLCFWYAINLEIVLKKKKGRKKIPELWGLLWWIIIHYLVPSLSSHKFIFAKRQRLLISDWALWTENILKDLMRVAEDSIHYSAWCLLFRWVYTTMNTV